MDTLNEPEIFRSPLPPRAQAGFEVVLIFLLFFMHAGWPAPEVNEAHYLSKAKHYWNPTWCEHDFFCNTADAHQEFYWTFGWVTRFMSLSAAAWTGRLIIWSLLAWAWRRFSVAIVPRPFAAVLSAGLFLTLLSRAHLAGEWMIGGVEAKGFAFVFGLLGIEAVVRDRWNRAWLYFGAAAAFHVLVGGWLVVAAGLAWMLLRLSSQDRPSNINLWALILGGIIALPGLIPALLLTLGTDPTTVAEAGRIYVYERLGHHLVPQRFELPRLVGYALMLIVWLAMVVRTRPVSNQRRLVAIVNGSLVIVAIGLLFSFVAQWWPERAAAILRFYWFRTSDILLPLGLALMLTTVALNLLPTRRRAGVALIVASMLVIGWHLGTIVRSRATDPIPPGDRRLDNPREWREMCEWVATHTPVDAVFLTPRMASTFRWYANRAEVVSWKDVPQDAAGIVAWWQRLSDVHDRQAIGSVVRWQKSASDALPEELVRLGNKYGAEFLITASDPPLPFELVSPPNPGYAVYRLPKHWEPLKPLTTPSATP